MNDNIKKYPLTLENFSTLISSTCGNSNTREIEQYTNYFKSLCNMLYDMHGLVQERNIKARLTLKICFKILTSFYVLNPDSKTPTLGWTIYMPLDLCSTN